MAKNKARNRDQDRLRKALVELLNLPKLDVRGHEDDRRSTPAFSIAKRFIETYGPLRTGEQGLFAEAELFEYAKRLRQVWVDADKGNFRAAESTLNEILQASDPVETERSGFTVDLQGSQITAQPKPLIQQLALELLYSRKCFRRCLECQDFFVVKNPSVRRKYCQNALRDCFRTHRNRQSKEDMRSLREKRKGQQNAKRHNR